MRVALVSDLHVEYHLDVVGHAARRVAEIAPDVLVVAGDVCPDLARLEASLRLINDAFDGVLLFLPGNHDLWCGGAATPGPDSRQRYDWVLPAAARRAGARFLGVLPEELGGFAFVGVTGWYDYSLRDPRLDDEIGLAAYREKRWSDVEYVDRRQIHWPGDDGTHLSDEELTGWMVSRLRAQLEAVASRVPIVVVTHMLTHAEVLGMGGPEPVDGAEPGAGRSSRARFQDGFMGSTRLGEEIARHAGVIRILSGHLHAVRSVEVSGATGPIRCDVSPIGYPRETGPDLSSHVARRIRILELSRPENSR